MSVWPGYYSGVANGAATGRMYARLNVVKSVARLPTDPLFYSDVTIQNIVIGSRYWLALASDDTVLASGTAASTEVDIAGVPGYVNPQLLVLRVRKASESPKYRVYTGYAYHSSDGATFYVAQESDGVAL